MRILLAVILSIGSIAVSAQSVGLKGGLNYSNIRLSGDGVDTDWNDFRPDFHLGLFGNFDLNESMSVQGELLYSREGAYYEMSDWDFRFEILQIPVLFRYTHAETFYVEAGPQFGIVLSGFRVGDDGISVDMNSGYTLSSTLFSVTGGAGANISDRMSAGVRYNFGVSDLFQAGVFDIFTHSSQVIQVYVAVKMN